MRAPQRLRHANAAPDRAGIGARRMTPRPADLFRADSPLLAPDGARIDPLAQRQRIHSQPFGEFVDRHLHAPGARRVSGAAHGGSGPGVGEDVVLRRFKVRTLVKRLGEIADSGVQADARGAVALDRNRRQRSLAPRADADALMGGRAIARVHLLLGPGQGQTDRRSRLTRQRDGEAAVGAERRFRAEPAAHAVDHDPHLIERQVESLGELAPHPGRELSGNMDRQAVGAPVGDEAVGLHAAMRLDLRAVLALDHDVRGGKPLRDVAAARLSRPAHVAVDRQAGLRDEFARRTPGRGSRVVDLCRFRPARLVEIDDEGKRPVIDADETQRLFGGGHRGRRDGDDRLADIANGRMRRIAEGDRVDDCAHPRIALGCSRCRWRAPRHAHGATGGCGRTACPGGRRRP